MRGERIRKRWKQFRKNRQQAVGSRLDAKTFLRGDTQIQKLLERDSEACKRKYVFEDGGSMTFPLEVVCRGHCSMKTIEMVYDANPEALPDALFRVCVRKPKLELIQFLVSKSPEGAAMVKDGRIPLHTACIGRAPLEVIKFLIESFPDGVGQRDEKTMKLPLHLAIEYGHSLDVVKMLVEQDPECLHYADYEITSVQISKLFLAHKAKFTLSSGGGLPLHIACKKRAPLAMIHYLVGQFPDAVRTKNRNGWLPLHYCCAHGAPLEVIQYLCTSMPSSLYEKTTHHFELPVHLAVGRFNSDYEVVKYLISRHTTNYSKPRTHLFTTYSEEAILQYAPPKVCIFLDKVVRAAREGYSYVPTREDPYN